MNNIFKKIQYFIFSIMYSALSFILIKGILILISEFNINKDLSMLIYISIGLLCLAIIVLALYNCIKKIFE